MASFDGDDPATSKSTGPLPPMSTSPLSRGIQFLGAQYAAKLPLNPVVSKRRMASPPPQVCVPMVLPVVMKTLAPSDATPLGAHAPPASAGVAHAVIFVGSAIETETIQPW